MAAPPPSRPGIAQQKRFIAENAIVLNRSAQLAILSIVMMEIGPAVATELSTGGTKELDLDLDEIARVNPDVLAHIYNIVSTRRTELSQPAGAASHRSA